LVAQLGEGDGPATAKSIAAAHGDDQRLGSHDPCLELGRHGLRAHPDDCGVELATGNGLEERRVVLLGHRDLDHGVRSVKVAEGLREAMVDGPGDTDPQPSTQEAAQRGDLSPAPLGRGKCRTRVWQKRLAGPSERDRALIAMKQRLPELALEATDLSADGRLGNRDASSGPRELPLLGHRHEVRELPQIHSEAF
jgi:hypothetical protein